jgi:ABC-type multidrug transport system ATPase subunit
MIALMGKNGAGKSTLLRMIAGLTSMDRGIVTVNGQTLKSGNPNARNGVLYLGHSPGMYAQLTAIENLSFAMKLYGESENHDLINNTLGKLKLSNQSNEPIQVYSQGMLQRLKLALAQVVPWKLLLFDEPLNGLDVAGQSLVEGVINDWNQKGRTMLLVVHDVKWAIENCQQLLLLHEGKIELNLSCAEADKAVTKQTTLRVLQ